MKRRALTVLCCYAQLERGASDGTVSAGGQAVVRRLHKHCRQRWHICMFSKQIRNGAAQQRARIPVTSSFSTEAGVCEDETRQCDKCVFWSSAAFGSKKKEKRCTASLKRLVGIKLEGLEIE